MEKLRNYFTNTTLRTVIKKTSISFLLYKEFPSIYKTKQKFGNKSIMIRTLTNEYGFIEGVILSLITTYTNAPFTYENKNKIFNSKIMNYKMYMSYMSF